MGYLSDKPYLSTILTFFTISVPYIADLILSILSYQEECKAYYIIRFVTQGISLLLIIILPFLIICLYYEDNNNPFAMGMIYVIFFVFLIIGIIPMEITSLVSFIRNYEFLFYLGKIGYFIHASFIGLIIFSFILGFIYFNWNYHPFYHDDYDSHMKYLKNTIIKERINKPKKPAWI